MNKILLVPVLSYFLVSCSLHNITNTSGSPDFKNGIMLDTKKNRILLLQTYSNYAKREATGGKEESETWKETWKRIITSLRDGTQENSDFYVDYIIERRRQLGLPDLQI